MVVLVGDVGIGKTRLAEEFCVHVRESGGLALLGTCHDRPAGPAYAPWIEILRQWAQTGGIAGLSDFLAPRPPHGGLTPRERQSARLEHLVDLTALLRTATERGPACLVFDNLHWADSSTLLALQHVVRHLHEAPVMFVLTYRPTDMSRHGLLAALTAEIARSERGLTLSLGPLALEEVEEFVRELGRADARARCFEHLAAEIHGLTEGNPLFLTQLARLLLLRGKSRSDIHLADLNLSQVEGMREVIIQRLAGISPSCQEWLEAAAVFGREFTGQLVGESIGLSPEALRAAIDMAVDMHLVVPRDDAPERYQFVHNMFREVLYGGLPPDRRKELHALAGAAIERQALAGLDEHCATLAHHYSAAATVGHTQKAVEYCVRAGNLAASHCAWEEACAHWRRGLELMELLPVDAIERSPSTVSHLCEDLGDGEGLVGDSSRALEAYEHAANNLPPEERISLARVRRKQVQHFHTCGQHSRAIAAVRQADALLQTPVDGSPPEWWREWIEVHHERTRLHLWAGETEEAQAILRSLESAVACRGTDSQSAQHRLLQWRVEMRRRRFLADAGTETLARACAGRFIALGSLGDLQDAQMVLGMTYLYWPAERGRAHEYLLCYLEQARQNHDVLNQMRALAALSLWHRWRGETGPVSEYAAAVLALATQGQMLSQAPEARGDQAWVAWRKKMAYEARALAASALQDFERQYPRSPFEWRARWPLFGLSVAERDLEQAALHGKVMGELGQSRMPDELSGPLTRFVERGSGTEAERRSAAREVVVAARALGYL
jgi:AAA ATPase domain